MTFSPSLLGPFLWRYHDNAIAKENKQKLEKQTRTACFFSFSSFKGFYSSAVIGSAEQGANTVEMQKRKMRLVKILRDIAKFLQGFSTPHKPVGYRQRKCKGKVLRRWRRRWRVNGKREKKTLSSLDLASLPAKCNIPQEHVELILLAPERETQSPKGLPIIIGER